MTDLSRRETIILAAAAAAAAAPGVAQAQGAAPPAPAATAPPLAVDVPSAPADPLSTPIVVTTKSPEAAQPKTVAVTVTRTGKPAQDVLRFDFADTAPKRFYASTRLKLGLTPAPGAGPSAATKKDDKPKTETVSISATSMGYTAADAKSVTVSEATCRSPQIANLRLSTQYDAAQKTATIKCLAPLPPVTKKSNTEVPSWRIDRIEFLVAEIPSAPLPPSPPAPAPPVPASPIPAPPVPAPKLRLTIKNLVPQSDVDGISNDGLVQFSFDVAAPAIIVANWYRWMDGATAAEATAAFTATSLISVSAST